VDTRESIIVGTCIAILAPVCLFFAAWWLSFAVVSERLVPVFAFGGLGLGILLDAFFLRRWTLRAYGIRLRWLAALYIFVAVIAYAVSMGVPVLILVPGVLAGAYMGRRLRHARSDVGSATRVIRRTSLFLAGVIACACGFSAFLALREHFTGSDIDRMFNLKFHLTRPMISVFIAVGGAALVACQYWLAARFARLAIGRQSDAAREVR
jgi:hypothetical protein